MPRSGLLGQRRAHRRPTRTGKGQNPWPASEFNNVRDNACANCHRTHTAGTPERLLTFPEQVDTRLVCHAGNVARKNIEREVRKPSAHNVLAST
ncbi:MAG: cytochrome c3 family protein [Kiritimatiellia bacterium]